MDMKLPNAHSKTQKEDYSHRVDIFNATFDSIFIVDQAGQILEANKSAYTSLDFNKEELEGKSIFDLLVETSDEDDDEDLFGFVDLKKLIKQGMINSRRLTLQTKNRDKVPVLFSAFRKKLDVPNDNYVVCIAKDITALDESLKNLETERSVAANAAKMAALGEMAAGIAHELNTPLAIITGRCYHLKELLNSEEYQTSDVLGYIESIERTTGRIASIVKGLRNISRSSDDDPTTLVSFVDILSDTKEFCQYKLNKLGIAFKICDFPAEVKIHCRPAEISQVMLNLINNAADAIFQLDQKWIRIEGQKNGDKLSIMIKDSGSGIPKKIQEKIMEPFFTTKDIGKGTGLGLSISRNLLENHKGTLSIDNSCENTCFVIELPIATKD